MKEYQKVLVILESTGTHTSKQNKLTKISIETEDPDLKVLTKQLATMYSYYIKPSWYRNTKCWTEEQLRTIPQSYDQWVEYKKPLENQLRQYLEMRIAQGTPQWQVIAKKHGWGPLR